MKEKFINFDPRSLQFVGTPMRKLPYPVFQNKIYDYSFMNPDEK